jgi:hypothetical protein
MSWFELGKFPKKGVDLANRLLLAGLSATSIPLAVFALPMEPAAADRWGNALPQIPSRHLVAAEATIDYDAIVGDVVQIFKWLEEPGMNDTLLAARLRNDRCVSDCPIVLNFGTDTVDSYIPALASRKYIKEVIVSSYELSARETRPVYAVKITLKEESTRRLVLSQLYQKLIGRDNVPSTPITCQEGDLRCPNLSFARMSLKERHFPNSRCDTYPLRLEFYRSNNYLHQLILEAPSTIGNTAYCFQNYNNKQ